MKFNEHEHFITSDFYAAVFLIASDMALFGINKSDPKRFRFIFEDSKKRAGLLEDFFGGQSKINPQKFIAGIKNLKSLMYTDALNH